MLLESQGGPGSSLGNPGEGFETWRSLIWRHGPLQLGSSQGSTMRILRPNDERSSATNSDLGRSTLVREGRSCSLCLGSAGKLPTVHSVAESPHPSRLKVLRVLEKRKLLAPMAAKTGCTSLSLTRSAPNTFQSRTPRTVPTATLGMLEHPSG